MTPSKLTLADLQGQTILEAVEITEGYYELRVETEDGLRLSIWVDSGMAPCDYEVSRV